MRFGRIFLALLLVATLFACGGSGGGSGTLKFAAPTIIPLPADGTTTINGFASNGKMVGTFLPTGSTVSYAYYWSSPSASPTQLAGTDCAANAINEAGEIVGTIRSGVTTEQAAYWPSSTVSATILPNPSVSSSFVSATSINSQSQIVGIADGKGVYWNAAHTSASNFAGPNDEDIYNCAISDSGGTYMTVQGSSSPNALRPCFAPEISTGVVLEVPGSNLHTTYSRLSTLNRFMGQAPLIDLDNSGAAFGSELLLDPTRTPFVLPGINAYARYIGNDGKICGTRGGGTAQVAVVWGSGVSFPVDLNGLIPATPDLMLRDALFQTADGSIIGKATLTTPGVTKEVYFFAQRLP
jgi:hypothetical protein